ncbi:hypothetical protein [Ferrimicrobium sp.]|uniref:hypothetical protein n=1 Tax=Ferrimicrobium sp. TaxID=2926050 RepID=UPI00260505F3|nr:hypothetical protein [Ferrimicrobium sp.]
MSETLLGAQLARERLALSHLGVGPMPLAGLVFPAKLAPRAQEALREGRALDETCELAFLCSAAAGHVDQAQRELAQYAGEDWAEYDCGVLAGRSGRLQTRDRALTVLDAIAAFVLGDDDANLSWQAATMDEGLGVGVRAWAGIVGLAWATEIASSSHISEALTALVSLLDQVEPLQAAMIQRSILPHRKELGISDQAAVTGYREVIATLKTTCLLEDLGSAWLELGGLLHEMGGANPGYLREAVKCYQESTKIFSRTSAPVMFASIQVDIAVCYLAMPMLESSDAVRFAVAISSLREAMRVFTPEEYPRQWFTCQLNLANALVYSPSAHSVANIVEAVDLYSELAGRVNPLEDPMGYARLMFNWGNALAHLGDFVEARSRLHEARRIFEEFEIYDEVRAVRDVLDEMERSRTRGVVDGAL